MKLKLKEKYRDFTPGQTVAVGPDPKKEITPAAANYLLLNRMAEKVEEPAATGKK